MRRLNKRQSNSPTRRSQKKNSRYIREVRFQERCHRGNITKRKYICIHELIGLNAKVLKSSSTYTGLEGRVLWETRNALCLDVKGTRKLVPKKGNIFLIQGKMIVGDALIKHPVERTKSLRLRACLRK